MTENEFKAFVNSHEFRFAKSMPDIPHAYIVRAKVNQDELFTKAVQYVIDNGYDKKFYSKTYRYFDFEGYQYWSMGWPSNETTILNRAKI